jgi:hypothetical protein
MGGGIFCFHCVKLDKLYSSHLTKNPTNHQMTSPAETIPVTVWPRSGEITIKMMSKTSRSPNVMQRMLFIHTETNNFAQKYYHQSCAQPWIWHSGDLR